MRNEPHEKAAILVLWTQVLRFLPPTFNCQLTTVNFLRSQIWQEAAPRFSKYFW